MSLKAQVSFKIPGKTFLIGEYMALWGGPSLVLSTVPFFEVLAQPGIGQHPFHPESPAGAYIHKHKDFFSHWNIQFKDTYQTGGFGASTAQFAAVALLRHQNGSFEQEAFFSTKKELALEIWQEYRDLFSALPIPPSGADLVAQLTGEINLFDGVEVTQQSYPWPFADQDVLLFKTPYKVATHEHLAQLSIDRIQEIKQELEPILNETIQAFKRADGCQWIYNQLEYSKKLQKLGLHSADTELLIEKILKIPGVIGARGCGALGADVIAVTIERNKLETVASQLPELKLIASLHKDIAYGPLIAVSAVES